MPGSKWNIYLAKSSNMEKLADLTNVARNKSLSIALNKSGSLGCDLPLDNPIVEEFDVVNHCLRAFKNDVEVWSGPVWTMEENLPDNSIQITANGWFELLRKRFHIKDTSVFSATNMGVLIYDNLSIANGLSPSYITQGTSTATGVITKQWKQYDNIGDAIEGVSEIENGPDFFVDPTTRKLEVVQHRETDQTDVLFGYNFGPSNVKSLKRTTDADAMANYIIATGNNNLSVGTSSSKAIEEYQLFQRIDSLPSNLSTETLTAYVNAEIVLCANPRVIYSFTPFPSRGQNTSVPSIFEDYAIGDKVYLSAKWSPRFDIDKQAVRVFATTIQIDMEGNETVGELQTTFSG